MLRPTTAEFLVTTLTSPPTCGWSFSWRLSSDIVGSEELKLVRIEKEDPDAAVDEHLDLSGSPAGGVSDAHQEPDLAVETG
jgi:hypothetical protein